MGPLGAPPVHVLDALGLFLGSLGALFGSSWEPLGCLLGVSWDLLAGLEAEKWPWLEREQDFQGPQGATVITEPAAGLANPGGSGPPKSFS